MEYKTKIKFCKLTEDAIIPEFQTDFCSGMDLCANEYVVVNPNQRKLISTGLIIEIPVGLEGQVRPRSGLALKNGLTVLNAPGTLDADFRGEIKVILFNTSTRGFEVTKGMRIAQLVISPVIPKIDMEVEVISRDQVSVTERNLGGFGSTGV